MRRLQHDTYSVEVYVDLATSIDRGLLTAQLNDFAEYADGPVGEGLEVWGRDSGCNFLHFYWFLVI